MMDDFIIVVETKPQTEAAIELFDEIILERFGNCWRWGSRKILKAPSWSKQERQPQQTAWNCTRVEEWTTPFRLEGVLNLDEGQTKVEITLYFVTIKKEFEESDGKIDEVEEDQTVAHLKIGGDEKLTFTWGEEGITRSAT